MGAFFLFFALGAFTTAAEDAPVNYSAALAEAASARGPEQFEARFRAALAAHRRENRLDDTRTEIAVRADIAAVMASNGSWANAVSQNNYALSLARTLGDPDLLINHYLRRVGYLQRAGNQPLALAALEAVDKIITPLDRPADKLEAALLRAGLFPNNNDDGQTREAIYDVLLARDDVDRLRVEHHRAQHTQADHAFFDFRWTRVRDLARAARRPAIEAEALDQLGFNSSRLRKHLEAAAYFTAAEALGVAPKRDITTWLQVIETRTAIDDRSLARHAITQAFAVIDENRDPQRAAVLHQALGELHGRDGDFEAAFREAQLAHALMRRQNAKGQAIPVAAITRSVAPGPAQAAAELAAVRNGLREAELQRARLQHQRSVALAVTALLATALLGLAYAYKRRSAVALAEARVAAELRAERTHWQMLRYQLSPHFLFNALTSLGGLVVTDPRAAGRVVDRLSEFCQLALDGSSEVLRTLEHEMKLIRAFLDVEQAGAGDTLRVEYDVDPAALSARVPPLLLQPLVENALKYGGQTSPELLEVKLTIRSTAGGGLFVEVANTGAWVEASTMPRKRAAVGLANIRERLARLGLDAGALATHAHGGWVRVSLHLPALATNLPVLAT